MLYRSLVIISTVNYINYIHYHQSSQWLPLARSHGWTVMQGRPLYSGPVQEPPPPPPATTPAATTNRHQRTHGCYLGLRRPDRAGRAESRTTTRSDVKTQKYFISRNIEIQTSPCYSSHRSLSSFNSCFRPFSLIADSHSLCLDGRPRYPLLSTKYIYKEFRNRIDLLNVGEATDQNGRNQEVNVMFGSLPGMTGTSQDNLFH